jgi:hypothetical protein
LRHVAHVEEIRNAYNILVGKSEEKRPLGRLGVKQISGKQDGKVWTGGMWLRIGTSGEIS